MPLPSDKALRLAGLSLLIILIGQGAEWSTEVAWVVFSAILLGCLVDGLLIHAQGRVYLYREAPAQLHVDQVHEIEWVVEIRSPFSVALALRDQAPSYTRANPAVLEASLAASSRARLSYELVPGRRGNLAFGDAVYRVRGPLGLTWLQRRVPAEIEIRCLPHLANWKASELAERQALLRKGGSHR